MLSPDAPASRLILWVLLALIVVVLAVRAVRKDRREYGRFKRFERTRNRQRMMRKWLIDSVAVFGGSSVILLLLVWRYLPLFLDAVNEWPPFRWLRGLVEDTGGFIPGVALGAGIALIVGTVIAVYLARKSGDVPTIGDIGAILPRNRTELRYGAALSVNAGLVEELMFRLAVPTVVFGASGSAPAAVIASILLFGSLHVYQGLPGIVGSTVIGAVLMLLFLSTGSIIVPIVVHALIDLRSLVLIPVLVFGVARVRA
ncbi:CPBP family intramembrane glutamic endopeptidase [Lacisediminihabitans changchengi]|uniref:CPBP family intramembrane metalloprotease n=1 Tax=Lacisediminihabitans changchengi TaxID=2787634 RepID=A0A934SIE1_9MICO|nr:type II CAAX endopeptidase family protein [Lacisediminihabitans changchengi]MBK4347227.1 CPBP family intramembrane metalloprotease [Lacisediminihabitans changchengi]